MRESYRVLLQSWYEGIVVVQCHTGDEAWEQLSRADPGLFITDLYHTGLSCREMLRLLAARQVKYPIFVISGYESEEIKALVRQLMDRGLNVTFVAKPPTVVQLRSLLSKHLGPGDNLKCVPGNYAR
jgi:DNA-binding NarL/FixJ family response regulator